MGPDTLPLLGKEALPGDSDRLNVANICKMHAEIIPEYHCEPVVSHCSALKANHRTA